MAKPSNYDTGEILDTLPSPYIPHAGTGLLHLPRFLAKVKQHLNGGLPKSYQRNFTRGFDGFLCMHLGIEPDQVIEIVRGASDDQAIDSALAKILPEDLRVAKWNRELVQKGMSEMGRESLESTKKKMGIPERTDLISFADMIDYVPPALPPLKARTFLKVLEDNDAVIHMCIKSRAPKLRHLARTLRVDLDWLFE